MLNHLRRALLEMAPITEETWAVFAAGCKVNTIPAGDYFLRIGDDSDQAGYLVEGICRRFYVTPQGREYTHNFYLPGSFFASYAAALSAQKATANIVTIEDSKIISFSLNRLQSLYDIDPGWDRIGRKVAETVFIQREKREYQLLMLSAAERYHEFKKEFPTLEQKLPNTLLASYLGITPEAFSRLVKSL